jgi:hypothetical protein
LDRYSRINKLVDAGSVGPLLSKVADSNFSDVGNKFGKFEQYTNITIENYCFLNACGRSEESPNFPNLLPTSEKLESATFESKGPTDPAVSCFIVRNGCASADVP